MAGRREAPESTDCIVYRHAVVSSGGRYLAGWERRYLSERCVTFPSYRSRGREGGATATWVGQSLRSRFKFDNRPVHASIREMVSNTSFDQLFSIEYVVLRRIQETFVPPPELLLLKHGLIDLPLEALSLLGALIMLTGRFFWNDPLLLVDRAGVFIPRPASVPLPASRAFICPRLSRPPPQG